MSKGKPQQRKRARVNATKKSQKKSWWNKPKVWLGGAITTIITGVATGLVINALSPQTQTAASSPAPVSVVPTSTQSQNLHASTRPTNSVSPKASSGSPLAVLSEASIHDFGSTWVFPGKYLATPQQISYLKSTIDREDNAAYNQWFYSRGAYATAVDMQLVVQNNRHHLVRILDMNVLKACQSPLTGTLFFSPDAGADDSIRLGFNLNSSDTDAEAAKGWTTSTWMPHYFAGDTVPLQPQAQQVFEIRAVVSNASCTFRIQAKVLDGTKTVYQVISDEGHPFRVTSIASPFGDTALKFSDYRIVYAGGIATPDPKKEFVRVNPKTYNGG